MYGGVSVMQSFNLIEIATPTNTRRVRGNPKHITSEEDYEAYIDRYNGRSQVYISLNPVNPNSSRFPTDKDITVWCNELLDLDLEKPIEIDEDVPDNYPKKCKHYAAREADLEKLKPYIERINEWLVSRGLKTGYQDHTGNGYRFILPVPGVVLEGMDLEAFAAQKREFREQIARDCGIVDGCGVHLDSVFDPRRITGVPDTLNFKLETATRKNRIREPFRGVERDEDETLKDYILDIEIPKPEPHTNQLQPHLGVVLGVFDYWVTRDAKLRSLYEGDTSGYNSESEAELALATKLVYYQFSKSEIRNILLFSDIGKASKEKENGNDQYIQRTINKAFELEKNRVELNIDQCAPIYTVENGCFVKNTWKKVGGKVNGKWALTSITLGNFSIELEVDIVTSDGIDTVRWWSCKIIVSGMQIPFKAEAERFVTTSEFARLLVDAGGSHVKFENHNLQDIRLAMQEISDPQYRNVRITFGLKDNHTYETPSVIIDRDGVKTVDDCDVDLLEIENASNLDMDVITDEEFQTVGNHILIDLLHIHERYPVNCLFGHTFMSPFGTAISEVRGWTGEHIGLWLLGTTGCGKSYTAARFQNFFGHFNREGSVISWSSTPYRIQYTGYYFKDALFLVDDFKISYFRGNKGKMAAMTEVLQNYTDGRCRGRLTSDIKARKGHYIKGNLVVTGEDLPHNESSVVGRYHIIKMDKSGMNREAGRKCLEYQHLYKGFMARFIAWVIRQERYAEQIVDRINQFRDGFIGDRTSTNIDRIAQSFAYNLTGYEMFCKFMCTNKFIEQDKAREMVTVHKSDLEREIDSLATFVHASTASEVFIATLRDLINSGRVKIQDWNDTHMVPNPDYNPEHDDNKYVQDVIPIEDMHGCIGFDKDKDDQYLYIFPQIAFREVVKLLNEMDTPFNHTQHSLVEEMIKEGILTPGKDQAASTVKYQNKTRRAWQITKKALRYEILEHGQTQSDEEDG
jgi:hypothetical protein